MTGPLRRLAERLLPDKALEDFGRVPWRIEDSLADQVARGEVTVAAGGGIPMSRQLLNDLDPWRWFSPSGRTWRRWPVGSIMDLIPSLRYTPGSICYQVPLVPPPSRRRRWWQP